MSFTILLVEDDLDSRNALTLLLELEGFNIISASDGSTALELAETYYPDLVITDICMPGMSGIELTKHLRSSKTSLKSLPIIAVTAATEQTRQVVLDVGASACFAKPIDVAQLHNTIYDLFAKTCSATISKIA